jgi:histidine triad (HIT) family protein
MMQDCIFCKIAEGTIPARTVKADDDLIAFHDLDPKAPVHVLVITRKHIGTLNEIGADDAALLGRVWSKIPGIAAELGIASVGYRVVVNCLAPAGQSVFHLHFHLLGGRAMGWPPG